MLFVLLLLTPGFRVINTFQDEYSFWKVKAKITFWFKASRMILFHKMKSSNQLLI